MRVGKPGLGYPWSWSVVPWLAGEIAARVPPADPFVTAEQLGTFLHTLHEPAPEDAPVNPYRGGPLTDRAPAVLDRIRLLGDRIDGPATLARWEMLSTVPWSGARVWLHGDLHPANVLVAGGRIAGVIDFGDISGGDRATDLSVAWMLLPAAARDAFRVRGRVRRRRHLVTRPRLGTRARTHVPRGIRRQPAHG